MLTLFKNPLVEVNLFSNVPLFSIYTDICTDIYTDVFTDIYSELI